MQATIAGSSLEAEYSALYEATREAIYLRNLLEEAGFKQPPTPLHIDNQGSICVAQGEGRHSAKKHFDLKWCLIPERVKMGHILPMKIASQDNPADAFTKCLDTQAFIPKRALLNGSSPIAVQHDIVEMINHFEEDDSPEIQGFQDPAQLEQDME